MEHDVMILGNGKTTTFNSFETKLNNMTLVLGSSGSGKTERIVKPQILNTFNNNLIISMAKTNDMRTYQKILEDRGYTVEVIDFTDLRKCTIGFDPFVFIENTRDIKNLAKSIVSTTGESFKQDPYWDNVACQAITGLIALMDERYLHDHGVIPSLTEFMKYYRALSPKTDSMSSIVNTSLDRFFDDLYMLNHESFAYQSWKAIRGLASKTSSCVFSNLYSIIDDLFTPEVVAVSKMEKQVTCDFFDDEKTALFLITSPVDKSANKYIDLFYTAFFAKLFEDHKSVPLSTPLHLIYDDFACTSKIINFEQYISIFRSLNVSMTIILQSISQLNELYGTSASSTIIDNCDRTIFLGSSDVTTCQIISKRANQPLYNIINMPINWEIVFERGHKPDLVEKYNTYEDKYYKLYFNNVVEMEK